MTERLSIRELLRRRVYDIDSYTAIARACGIHKSTISRIVCGRLALTGNDPWVSRMVLHLGVTRDQLVSASRESVRRRKTGGRP